MAKRYKQSVKSRMSESRGMERYETKKKMKSDRYESGGVGNRFSDEYYRGEDPGRKMERKAGSMINEDHSAMANLPQDWFIKTYYKTDYINYGNSVDDTMHKPDSQKDQAVNFAKKHRPDSMY